MKEIAAKAIELATKEGATGVRVTIDSGIHHCYSYEQGELEVLHRAESNIISLDLFINGRCSYISGNNPTLEGIGKLVKEGMQMARVLSDDPCNTLPNPELCYKGGAAPLALYDNAIESLSTEQKIRMAQDAFEEIVGSNKSLIDIKSTYEDSAEHTYIADSQGFEGEADSTEFGISTECSIDGGNGAIYDGFWGNYATCLKNLELQGCSKRALERAVAKIGAAPVKGGKVNVVFNNTVSGRLVAEILTALQGGCIQQNRSFLCGCKGKRVFGDNLTILDNPHIPGKCGSRYFDSEGLATKPSRIICGGVVTDYYLNTYFANKLNCNATIEGPSAPCIDYSAFKPQYRDLSYEQMLSLVDKGIVVTNFIGGRCNTATGDFSFGIEGFMLEGGKIGAPICKMNITGNMTDLWNSLLFAAQDAREGFSWQIPSLAFENLTLT